MTVCFAVQRESVCCELSVRLRVLPLSLSGKPERMSALRTNEESSVIRRSFEFGWYRESLRPITATGLFLFYLKLIFYLKEINFLCSGQA